MGHMRKTGQYPVVPHVANDTAPSCHHIIVTDSDMPYRSRLPAKGIVVADGHAAGNPYQCHKQVVFPYYVVMPQMNQVIQFGTVAYNRASYSCPVYAGIAADLHIIT